MSNFLKKLSAATFAVLVFGGAIIHSADIAHAGKSATKGTGGSVSGMDLGSGR